VPLETKGNRPPSLNKLHSHPRPNLRKVLSKQKTEKLMKNTSKIESFESKKWPSNAARACSPVSSVPRFVTCSEVATKKCLRRSRILMMSL